MKALIEKRQLFCRAALAVLAAAIAAAMIRLPLTWGLMDDHVNLEWIHGEGRPGSLLQFLRDHSFIFWFRPVYAFYVYVAYGLFQDHPTLFYLANFGFVMGCCVPWAALLGRHLAPDVRRDGRFLFAFLLFAWTSMSTLIVYLSLQEKFIILFAGTVYYSLERAREGRYWAWTATAAVALTLALLTKPTTLAFVPWIALSLLAARDLPRGRQIGALAALLIPVAVMFVVFLRYREGYSDRYWEGWGMKLLSLQTRVYGFILLGIGALALLIRRQRREGPPFPQLSPALAWPLTLLAYLALQIPWGLFSYNWTPAMVLASGCIVVVLDVLTLPRPALRKIAVIGSLSAGIVLASAVTVGVTIPRLAEQSELTPLIQWLRGHVPDPTVDVYVLPPLYEGRIALMSYTGRVQAIGLVHPDETVPQGRPKAWLIAAPGFAPGPLQSREFQHAVFRTAHWTIWERGP